jgi:murein DD-endopeptidase MepM/ murein hydrolase activator NlpD
MPKRKIYYYSDDHVGLIELKWLRLKMTGAVAASVVVVLAVAFAVGYFYRDSLGLGSRQISSLQRENEMLNKQMSSMLSQMKKLETSVNDISDEGNHLRLLVDLPAIDNGTKQAGSGGAVTVPSYSVASNSISDLIKSASTTIDKLTGEVEIQKQNYAEVAKKHEYNKGYFASLPALKPMDGYYSTSSFGMRIHPVLGIWKNHEGLDIVNDVGTPVYASGNGTVGFAGQSGGGYGTMIVINHGYGYETVYGHLSKVLVREGQHVKRGDMIAKSGRTGLVSGPHLHYEVRYKGVIQNPVNYFLDDIKPQGYKATVAAK